MGSNRRCSVCDAPTNHVCGQCLTRFYCSQEHQIRDWEDGHAVECAGAANADDPTDALHRSAATFARGPADPGSVATHDPVARSDGGSGRRLFHEAPGSTDAGASAEAAGTKAAVRAGPAPLSKRDALRTEAIAALDRGEWTTAVERGLESWIATWSHHGCEHPDLITECVILSKAYAHLDRDASAEQALQRYLTMARTLAQQQPYAHALSNAQLYCILGELYLLLRSYDEAERMYGVYVGLVESYFGEDHLATSDARMLMSSLCAKGGRYSEALEHAGRALVVRIDKLGLDHMRTSDAHFNVGVLHRLNGDAAEALRELRYALETRTKLCGEASLPVAQVLYSMGIAEHQRGEFTAALGCLEKALAIRLEHLGAEHKDSIDVCYSISALYFDTGLLDRAAREAKTCLALRRRSVGENHPSTADAHTHLANICYRSGRREEATSHYSHAHAIYSRTLGFDHPKCAYTQRALVA